MTERQRLRHDGRVAGTPAAAGRKRLWLYAGAIVCALAWLGLGLGLALGVERQAKLVLAIAAALATEGLFWLAALVLGMKIYEVRRQLWRMLARKSR